MTSLNKNLDKIYVVSLKERIDRRALIKDQFYQLDTDYELFDAIKNENGSRGNKQSQLQILEKALCCGYKKIMICEDDVLFRKKISEDFEIIMREAGTFDLLYFHHPQPSDIIKENNYVITHKAPWCTQCYCVGNIEKVVNHLKKNIDNKHSIDHLFVNSSLDVKITTEEYALQLDDFSDIQRKIYVRFKHKNKYNDLLIVL